MLVIPLAGLLIGKGDSFKFEDALFDLTGLFTCEETGDFAPLIRVGSI